MEERPASTSTTTTGESETAQEATLPPTSVEVDKPPQVEENPYNVQLTTTTTTAQPCNDLKDPSPGQPTMASVKLPMAPLVDYGIEDSADESECKDEEPSMPPPATVGDHAIETNNQNETTEEKVEEEVRPPTLPTDNPVVNETVPSPGQGPLESEMKELQLNHQQPPDGPEIEEIDIDYEEVVLPVQLEVEAQPPPQVEVSEEPEVNHPQSVASESAVLAPSMTSTTTPAEVVTTTTEQPTAMEVDEEDPLVETILFTSGQSSAETIVGDEEMVTLNKTVVQEPPPQQQPEEEQQLTVEAPDLSDDHLEKQEMIKEATAAVDSQQSTDTATILNSTDSSLPEDDEIASPSPMMVEVQLEPSVTSTTTATVKGEEFPGSDLFKSVKFAVCEDMENVDKIKRLLVGNGAKFLNYLSDSATHLIADNGEHLSVSEAIDIYEKPVVTSQWVYLSLRSGKVLPLAPFSPFRDRLFSSVVACPSRLSPADRAAVWSMITYHGGAFQTRLDAKVTHLITGAIAGAKYETACRQLKTCRIVTPDWVVDSVRKKGTVEEERYHPKLLLTYNAGKKVESRKQAETSNKQSSSGKEADTTEDGASLQVPRATKSVTMAISTEAVLSRKVDPVKIEVETKPELPPSTAPPLVLVNVQTATATGLPVTANQTVPTHHSHSSVGPPNTQTGTFPPHRHPHPNQMQGGVHPQAHPGHPHGHHPQVYNLQHGQQQQQPHPQQSKAVQLMAHGQQAVGHFAAQQQQQQQMHPQHAMQANRHMAPNMQQGQMMPGQHAQQHPHGHPGQPGMIHPQQQQQQQQQLHLQHQQQQAQQQQQMTMTGPQGKKKAGQVNAVKSKGTKGRGGPKKHQNQQQQQQQVQPGGQQQHVGGHHTPDRLLSPKLEQQPQQQGPMMHPQQQRPLTPQGGGVPMSYHPGAGMMQQQSPQPQMVSNSPMHSPTYRGQAPANVAMVQQQQQQQMGVMGQQQKQVMAPGHPQQQQAPRQVYLTLQQQQISQQQQMQFVNGQGQFVRGQFLQTRPGMHPQQVQQAQQQQAQQQQQMGVAGHGQVIPPGMQPQQQQAMYRHQAQYPQQQPQMHPQQQQRPMQYGAQGQQVYLNQQQQQQPGAQMGVPGQMQQQRMVVMQQQQQPVVSAQQQQVMMNQNAYTQMSVVHQQQEQVARSPAGMSPGAAGQQQAYPQQGQQQTQAGQPQQGVVGVPQQRMIRMANLTPEQQQQLIQQQKMQQQAAAQQKQSVANYQVNLQQQQQQPGGPAGQQMIRPMSHSPMSHSPMSHSPGQGSPQTPPQMLSPNGTPVPVQRMMLRPGMHPGQQVQQQQHQQQVYQQQQQQQQMVDPSKGPQQQGAPQQIAVRPPVPMTVQQQGGLPPQQFAANQQQIQFIRQRWPAPPNDGRQQFVGGPRPPGPPQQQGQQPHPQYVQMNAAAPGGVPRPMVAVTDLQLPPPPPHLNPQQQQIWLQNQQAQLRHRFQLLQQQRMAQQQQQAQQQRMNGPGTMQVQQQQQPGGQVATQPGPTMQQQQQPPMPDGAQSSTVKVRMSTGGGGSAVHGNSQVVSTAITAVVGGGLDTVISAAAHPVAAQTGLVQQQHFVQQQQVQGHAVGSVGPNSEQQQHHPQHHPQVSKAQTGAPASSTHQAPHPTAQPQPQQQHPAPGFHPQVSVNRESGGGTSSSSASSSSASTPTSSSTGGGGGSVVNEKTKTALANLLNNRLNNQQQQAANGSGHSSPTTPTAPGGLPQISTGVLGAALAGKPKGHHHHQQTQQGGRAAAAGTSMLANSGAIGTTSMTQQSTVPSSVSVSSDTVSGQPQSSSSSLASHAVAASEMTSHGQVVPPVPVGQHHQHHHPHHHQQAGSMAPGQMAPVGPNGVPLVQPPPQSLQPFSGHHGQGQQGGFPAQVPPPTQQQVAPPTPMMNGPSTLAHMPPHGHQGQQLRPGGLLPGGHHFTVHQGGAALNGPTLQSMNSQLGKAPPPTPNGPTPSNGQPVPTPTTPTTPSATSSTAPLPTIIQIRFFGHESRQVIPPEVCIIGCVFYIAPSYTENPSTAALVPGWKRTIEKYGGRVVDRYVSGPANPVTHVLTEHMHGAVQKTALGESKRCVSVFWLDDVLCNKRLLPPWRFYHLPVAYSGKLPCVNHIIAISNFEGEEREKLISLIRRTGAKYTNYLTSKNTILICKRLEGAKYEKALQWRIAIVNLCWLQDVFFGHLEALQLSSLPKKYQQFEQYAPTGPSAPSSASLTSGGAVNGASLASTGGGANMTPSQMLQRDIFRVDYSMVHTLMGPWRVPIKYDQEELADRLAKKAVEEETKRKEDAEKAKLKAEKEREEEAARAVEAEKEKELTKGLSDETVPMEETAVSAEKTTMEEVTPAVDGASTAMKRSFDEMKATEETTTPSSLEVMTPKLTEEKEKRDEVAPEAEPPSAKKAKLVEAGVEVKVEDSEMAEEELKAPVSEPEITPMEVVQVVETLQEAVSEGRDSSAEVPTATTTTADASTERSSSTKEPSLADTEEAMETDATPALVAKEAEPVRLEIKEEPTEEGSLQEKADSVGPEVTPVQMANGPEEQEKSVGPSEAQTGATIEPPVAAAAAAPIPLSVAELTETSSPANEDLSASVQFKVPMANGGGPIPTTAIGRTASTTPSPTPPLPPPARTISVLFTKLDPSTRSSLHATVLQLGGTVVTDPTTCTHLIADSLQPTVNFLCAFPRAQYVLTSAWLRESARTGVFTDEADYTLSDSEGEELYGVDLQAVLSTRTPTLLENTVFMMTRSCVPSPSLLRSIITANGGVAVLYQRPSRRQLDSLVQRKLDFVVVTCETDLHTCESFFKKNIKVVSVNCILNAVLRQKLDYETYAFTAPSAPTPITPTIKADSEGAKHGQVHPGLNHHPTPTQTPQVPPPNGLRGRSLLPSNLLQESLTSTS